MVLRITLKSRDFSVYSLGPVAVEVTLSLDIIVCISFCEDLHE